MTPIRIIHHLAATGGTIITRCLAGMDDVFVLSEMHPDRRLLNGYDPLVQASCYSNWIGRADMDAAFLAEIDVLYAAAERAGRVLLIRDWSHVDFMDTDTFQSRTVEALGAKYPLIRAASVRHPIDNWIAMTKNRFFTGPHGDYLRRVNAFVEMIAPLPTMQYERFCATPEAELGPLCAALGISYTPAYQARVPHIRFVTGASGRQSDVPAPRPREPIAPEDYDALISDPLLGEICARLGYPLDLDAG